ncbi:MAG TPA: isoleucine--tRNA ligase, partial [Dehalococcoidia bacterium]|nr:isoleucine--tRNA ligase [Dehalococcoidia bacterium]
NTALAVDSQADYVLVEHEGERLVVAAALLDQVVPDAGDVVTRLKGSDLVAAQYEGLYNPEDWGVQARRFENGRLVNANMSDVETRYRVYATDFVSMTDGTGIVHIAPAFGSEDFETGKKEGLLFLGTVDLRGNMPAGSPWGEVFVKDADPKITKDLQERGLMLRAGTVKHTYPFCWRCGTPVLYIAKPTWYIKTTQVKDRLLEANQRINWYPAHTKNGRFGNWLENNIDWAVSRERYWGTPLPVWVCQQGDHRDAVGSIKELREHAVDAAKVDALTDLHRPYIDEILLRCSKCGGEMKRAPEVLDAWYDSGAMPYAQWHYPFENDDKFDERFPADFICEAVDQTRGWFYTMHAEAVLLNYAAPELVPEPPSFKNVICLGLILDAKGEKMSKSRGNAVDPWDVINRSGADALRWYLYTATAAGEPRRFSPEQVQETLRKFLLTLWNTYSFFVTYARIDDFRPSGKTAKPESELDRWLLSELNLLVDQVTRDMDAYNPTDAGRAIGRFVDDLSNWYVRRSRRRFWKSESDSDKREAYETLYTALTTVARLLAPFTPFVAEEIYRNLVATADADAPESVHLADWPVADSTVVDERLTAETRLLMRLSSMGRAARSKAAIKVRQPLARVVVKTRSADEARVVSRLAALLSEELNVKTVETTEDEASYVTYEAKPNLALLGPKYGQELGQIRSALASAEAASVAAMVDGGGPVKLGEFELTPSEVLVERHERAGYAVDSEAGYMVAVSTEVTPELAAEGLAREVVHRLQGLRKSAGFDIADRIVTYVEAPDDVRRVLDEHEGYVRQETLSEELRFESPRDSAYSEEQTVDGHTVKMAVRRV